MTVQSVDSSRSVQGMSIRRYTQTQSNDAITLQHQQQMSAQFAHLNAACGQQCRVFCPQQQMLMPQEYHLLQPPLYPAPQQYHHQWYQPGQPPQLVPQQPPTPPYFSPLLHTSSIATPDIPRQQFSVDGMVDDNGRYWTKEQMHALMEFQVQQQQEERNAALMSMNRTQMQLPSPASSADLPMPSPTNSERHGPVSSTQTNQSSPQGAGRKRSLPDGDSVLEAARKPKARNVRRQVLKPSTSIRTTQSHSTGGIGTVPVPKVATVQQLQSLDATPHKKPRGRARKVDKNNEAPAVPAPTANFTKTHSSKVVDLTQPEKIQPATNSPHPQAFRAIKSRAELSLNKPPINQGWLQSPRNNGASMAHLERGSSTSSLLPSADNTMSTTHATAFGLPASSDMLPIRNEVGDPNFDVFAAYTIDEKDISTEASSPANDSGDADAKIPANTLKGLAEPSQGLHSYLRKDCPWTRSLEEIHMDHLPGDSDKSEEFALFEWGMQQHVKNRESGDKWGADSYGESTWNYDIIQGSPESLWNDDLELGGFEGFLQL
ncbi:hypothetical protein ACET3X_003333 [Alternaria dauci]|uniref:Uncharacterized protein n=1 Tax=Alternaria dauci TaxID=48095 RepID=A0ABR3UV50_9PLEO